MTPAEWIALCRGVRCAWCRQYILRVDSGAFGYMYVNSNQVSQCFESPKGMHWP